MKKGRERVHADLCRRREADGLRREREKKRREVLEMSSIPGLPGVTAAQTHECPLCHRRSLNASRLVCAKEQLDSYKSKKSI